VSDFSRTDAATFFSCGATCLWIPKWTDLSAGLHLLALSSPTAIAGFVVTIVVDAVKLVSWSWARFHVGKKQREVEPPFADRDSTASIVMETFDLRIDASLKHARPYAVFWDTSVPMLKVPVCSNFAMETTA
jgi:hypothetical protein